MKGRGGARGGGRCCRMIPLVRLLPLLPILLYLVCALSADPSVDQDESSIDRIVGTIGSIEKRRMMGPELENEKRSSSCRCQCRDRFRPGQWRCCSCTWTQKSCFPAAVHVTKHDGRKVRMEHVNVGDVITTVSNAGRPVLSEVVAFLHREPAQHGLYLTMRTAGGGQISLSPSHLLFASRRNATSSLETRFADEVFEGEYLFLEEGGKLIPRRVVEITREIMKGVYVPLTVTGTLLVNDVAASCYASVSHNIAHVAMMPMRWFPRLFHDPNFTGVHPYVRLVKQIGLYILHDSYKSSKHRCAQPDRKDSLERLQNKERLQFATNVTLPLDNHRYWFNFM